MRISVCNFAENLFNQGFAIKGMQNRTRNFLYVPVAQLDRVSDSDSDGCRFESCQAHHKEVVTFLWQLLYLMLITGFERAGSRIVTTTYISTKNNATK